MEQDNLNLSMFKSSDIRTKEENLNPQMTKRLLCSIASYMKDIVRTNTIVLGHDARLGVPALMQEALDLFPTFGINLVVNPLPISTPQFYYSCIQNPRASGIMFTASHNPGQYVGMKMIIPPMAPLSEGYGPEGGLTRIKELYIENSSPEPVRSKGKITVKSYLSHYIEDALYLAKLGQDSLRGMNVLCDFLCGAAGTEITEALTYCGVNVTPLHLVPDGRFPAGDPNPIILSSIKEAQKQMKKNRHFNFGLLFDGDGDRMDLMIPGGGQLTPSFNLSIIVNEIKRWHPELSVLVDPKVNPYAQQFLANGCDFVGMIKNGHSHIKQAMREEKNYDFYAACEESGHYYLKYPYNIKDFSKGYACTENTLYYALITARSFVEYDEVYNYVLDLQYKTYREREWTKHFDSVEKAQEVMNKVKQTFTQMGAGCYEKDYRGESLDATLLRYNLPGIITKETDLENTEWFQVFQRLSQSEDNVVRWEVTGSDSEKVIQAKEIINQITKKN